MYSNRKKISGCLERECGRVIHGRITKRQGEPFGGDGYVDDGDNFTRVHMRQNCAL